MIARLHRFTHRERWFPSLLLFVSVFVLLVALQRAPVFSDPDSFYHLGMAQEIRDHGVEQGFRWLPFTVLAQDYADQHFLYHVALIPFVTWLDPIVGMKLATALFGALCAVAFHALLARMRVPGAWWFTAALFLSNPFLFRMGLAKAPSVSLALLFLGLLLLFERRAWWLGALGFVYVWAYGGFPVLVVATVVFAAAAYGLGWVREGRWRLLRRLRDSLERRLHRVQRWPNARLVLALLLGVTLGLVLNPYFPAILRFEQHQLIEIGIVNYRSLIGVGGEWYPYPPKDLLLSGVFVAVAGVVGLVLFLANLRKQTAPTWTALALWLLFLAMTLKSKRYVEYYVPMGFLFAALAWRDTVVGTDWRGRFRRWVRAVSERSGQWALLVALAAYLTLAIGFVAVRDTLGVARDLGRGQSVTLFEPSLRFIEQRSAPGDVVFHDDWDVFPALFYRDRTNAYIAGLDATFLYRADPVRHRAWADVTLGRYRGDPFGVVHGMFGAKWVLVGKDHAPMQRLLDGKRGFELAYEDDEAWVYRVESPDAAGRP